MGIQHALSNLPKVLLISPLASSGTCAPNDETSAFP